MIDLALGGLAGALDARRPVVALETTLVAHGFPPGEGVEVGLGSERRVREAGAVPATIGVLDGAHRVGLCEDELGRFTADARKLGPRDLAACVAQRRSARRRSAARSRPAGALGIRFMGTGGIGGVHRGGRSTSPADLVELARTRGARRLARASKSLLDVPATIEVLEALGVPVLGYRTTSCRSSIPRTGGPPVPARVESPAEAAGSPHALGAAAPLGSSSPSRLRKASTWSR